MDIVKVIGLVLVTGVTCWILGWCASEASWIESERNRRHVERGRKDRW